MRRLLLFLISFFAAYSVSAQEKITIDSIPTKYTEIKESQPAIDKPLIFDEIVLPDETNSFDISIFHQPLLPDYNKDLDFKRYLNPSKQTSFTYNFAGSLFNPIFPFGNVYNQSSYKLSDRFLIGGNSFGAQSVFDRPKLNPTIQEMSIKGASMFMQYKVSDHFKVETRVSISNRRSSPWEP